MRVVIADDEKFVLVVLKSALKRIKHPVEIVGEAQDGEEAFRLCCEKRPDLLITDICMPRRDGLDLLAQVREHFPDLPVVIYSGFDSFSYAQRAIHYGIEEYLLKPIDEEKLEHALTSVLNRQAGIRKRKRAEDINRLWRQLVDCALQNEPVPMPLRQDMIEVFREWKRPVVFLFCMTGVGEMGQMIWRQTLLDQNVCCWCTEAEGRLILIADREAEPMLKESADRIWGKAYRMEAAPLPDVQSAGSIEGVCHRIRNVNRKAEALFWGDRAEDPEWEERPDKWETASFNRPYYDRLDAAVRLGKKEYLHSILLEYWQQLLKSYEHGAPSLLKKAAWNLMMRQCQSEQLDHKARQEIEKIEKLYSRTLYKEDVQKLLISCGDVLISAAGSGSGGQEDLLRDVIITYLQENYRDNLTLEMLAEYLHFSTGYTSELFKRLFGKSFVVYLTGIRIDAAKILLDSGKFKIYEIASQVGYQDEKYFLKLFKRVTGYTPKAYRKRDKSDV